MPQSVLILGSIVLLCFMPLIVRWLNKDDTEEF